MKFQHRKRSETAAWVLVAGVILTGAAAFAVFKLLRSAPVARRRELRALETRVVQALLDDPVSSSQQIDIAALGSGVIELSGVVEREEDARRVVARVDAVPGVHAVVNRLGTRAEESKLRRNRSARSTASEAVRWYGGTVGIGRRRQSFITDPPRRDDSADLMARALEPNRDDTLTDVEEAEGTGVRIGVSNARSLKTDVAPFSPNRASDEPGPPSAVMPPEAAQPD